MAQMKWVCQDPLGVMRRELGQRLGLLVGESQPGANLVRAAGYQVPLWQNTGCGGEHVLVVVYEDEDMTIPKVAPVGVAVDSV